MFSSFLFGIGVNVFSFRNCNGLIWNKIKCIWILRRLQGGWLVADGLWGVSVENFTYDTKLIRAVTGYKTYIVINCDYCFCCPLLFWVHFFRQMPTTSFKNIQYAKENTKAKWTLYTLNKIKKILSSFDFNFNCIIWRWFKKND